MLEIIGKSLDECKKIEKSGAGRIELVSSLEKGGLTPDFGVVEDCINNINIPICVMLRPSDRSFHYNKKEIDLMKEHAKVLEQMGVEEVVIGGLNQDGHVDEKIIDKVLSGTDLFAVFHRAIDESADIIHSVKKINSMKRVIRILTSGGRGKAFSNKDTIKDILNISNKKIVVGSGITLNNANELFEYLNRAVDIHIGKAVRKECDESGNIDDKIIGDISSSLSVSFS